MWTACSFGGIAASQNGIKIIVFAVLSFEDGSGIDMLGLGVDIAVGVRVIVVLILLVVIVVVVVIPVLIHGGMGRGVVAGRS